MLKSDDEGERQDQSAVDQQQAEGDTCWRKKEREWVSSQVIVLRSGSH